MARLGAERRLEEIRREEAAIRAAFPDLFDARRGAKASASAPARRRAGRSPMSPAARKAVSERMKKYWANRRKAKSKQE
ncbi:MAG: hypothetical protein AB1635_10740 [Acidobacteriota bacterium]